MKGVINIIKFLIILLIIVTSLPQNDSSLSLQKNDFSFVYNNVTINDSIPIEYITDQLGLGDRYIGNNYGLISQNNGVNRRGIYYPEQEPQIFLVYIDYNTTYLVFADLINLSTSRGIHVGDSVNKLEQKYGKGTINENYYEYQLNQKRLLFYFDNKTNKITRILIDYNMEKANIEQGIE